MEDDGDYDDSPSLGGLAGYELVVTLVKSTNDC